MTKSADAAKGSFSGNHWIYRNDEIIKLPTVNGNRRKLYYQIKRKGNLHVVNEV